MKPFTKEAIPFDKSARSDKLPGGLIEWMFLLFQVQMINEQLNLGDIRVIKALMVLGVCLNAQMETTRLGARHLLDILTFHQIISWPLLPIMLTQRNCLMTQRK